MSGKPFTVTREEAKELKRIIERIRRGDKGTPHEVVVQGWRDDMAVELRKLARNYERTGRGAKELLEGLVIAEVEGVDPKLLTKIRRDLGQRVTKRQAA
jgi:hypothetical protein